MATKPSLNVDECIFKLQDNINKSKLTLSERQELNECLDACRAIVKGYKNIKQTEGDPNGE